MYSCGESAGAADLSPEAAAPPDFFSPADDCCDANGCCAPSPMTWNQLGAPLLPCT